MHFIVKQHISHYLTFTKLLLLPEPLSLQYIVRNITL